MGFKTSHSQNSTYIKCSMHWYKSYVEKYKSPIEGASTYFGSAVDAAVTDMLLAKPDWLATFYDRWNKAYSFGKATQIFDNPDIIFGHKDFDKDVLEPKDHLQLDTWARGLNLFPQTSAPVDAQANIALYRSCADAKKNPYVKMSVAQLTFFNRASWLSMKRKGKVLLNAFHTQFYPKITKVISTQQRATITDPVTGDQITGFIDMVLEIQGYAKPIIFDLKTAGQPYDQGDIDLTQQLALYAAMKGKDYGTDLVGFVVLSKNITKKIVNTCKTCGHIRTGRHATCDAIVNNVRCNGAWDEVVKLDPQVQVLVESKSQQQIDDLLGDISNIVLAMKNNIVYKNVEACKQWFGGLCPFYDACHKNDYSGLIKK